MLQPSRESRLYCIHAGDDSTSEAAAAESAVKRAKQGKAGKAAPEDILNALAAAEEQHKHQQAVGVFAFSHLTSPPLPPPSPSLVPLTLVPSLSLLGLML